jgi:gamma-glutamyltranspeptidase/glutathione hydrolase
VAVPGCLAGYVHVHERLGRLPLSDVVAPAVDLAGGGVLVSPMAASLCALLWPIFDRSPDTHALFAPTGRALRAGDRMTNPDLADFLTRLGGPRPLLLPGALAEGAAADQAAGGGLVIEADLAAFEVVGEPLATTGATGSPTRPRSAVPGA